MNNQKGFLSIVIILLVIAGLVVVYLTQRNYPVTFNPNKTEDSPIPTSGVSATTTLVATTKTEASKVPSTWRKYVVSSPNLNYEINLPPSWIQVEQQSQFKGANNTIAVAVGTSSVTLKNDLNIDAKELVDFELNYAPGTSYHSPKLISVIDTDVSGQKAVRYNIELTKPIDDLPYNKESFIYLYKNNQIYSIYLLGNDIKTMNQIISTFKFTN